MKKDVNSKTVAVALGALAVVVVVAAVLYFKPSFGPGPVVQPKPFAPPAGFTPDGPHGSPSAGSDSKNTAKQPTSGMNALTH